MVNVRDARRRAKRRLPAVLFDYIDGGADDEITAAENERAFRELALRPRMGADIDEPSVSTSVLGVPLALPVMLAPCGMIQLVHPDGAVGVARAAAAAATVAVLSKIALCSPEEVADRAAGPHWFQVNSAGGREEVSRLMARAAGAGFTGLVVTMDGPPPGNHERDLRHGVVPPVGVSPHLAARLAGQAVVRPQWTAAMLAAGRRQRSTIQSATSVLTSTGLRRSPRFTWRDIDWIRGEWAGALVVKGVLTGDDALLARDVGADAVIVSNHGGRSLDTAPATMTALPEVVAALNGSAEVLLDGGVRRASDVVKAVCLGARAVLIGRPYVYGLACAGQHGVERILGLFQSELQRTMKLIGCQELAQLDPSWLQPMQMNPLVGLAAISAESRSSLSA
jgi:L-lactate dehydrogenase (cytochrome)